MPILKLTSVASLYGKPCKLNQWFRSLAAPIDTVSFPTSICCTGTFTSPVVRQRCSVQLTRDCRISPCVTLISPSHDKFSYGKLRFRRQRYFVPSEVKRVVVTNVVLDDKDNELGLDGELNTHSTLPAKNHHHSQESSPVQQSRPDKLLTLPTILTIARVIAVPLLITISAVREWAAFQNGKLSQAVDVNNLGKWKTATQMTALTILLATRDSSLTGAGTLVATGVLLLYISAWFALWSLVVYMKKIWKVLLM